MAESGICNVLNNFARLSAASERISSSWALFKKTIAFLKVGSAFLKSPAFEYTCAIPVSAFPINCSLFKIFAYSRDLLK